MIDQLKVLALIPARGGSKGIKDKNIIDVCGRPLIDYSIAAAKGSKYVDSIVVSTDSEKIQEVALACGARVPFVRPDEHATDTAKTVGVVVHALQALKEQGESYDVLLLLQPTQPLRTTEDIDGALELFMRHGAHASVVGIGEVEKHPLLMRTMTDERKLIPHLNQRSDVRRQEMDAFFAINGAIYINRVDTISESTSFNDNEIGYTMPRDRSVDIDDKLDLVIATALLKERNSPCNHA